MTRTRACLRHSMLAAVLLCWFSPAPMHAQDDALATAIRRFEAREFASARDLLQRVTAAEPRNAPAAFYLGRSLYALRDINGAVRWLEKATQLAPDSARYHLLLADAVGMQAQNASILKQPGLARKAKAALERAVELDPQNVDAHWGLMQFYLIAPGIVGGSDDKARAQAEIIAAIDPYFGEVARGTIADHTKKHAEAEQHFKRAIALRPDSVQGYNQLAALYRREPARPEMIVGLYERLAERRPGVATPQYLLGLALIEAERHDDARVLFLRAAASHPDDTRFIYQIGRLGALTGADLDRAEQNLRRYLTLTPEPGEPSHAAAHWRLGMIAEHRGDRTAARVEYEAALRLDPELAQAKEALKRLRE